MTAAIVVGVAVLLLGGGFFVFANAQRRAATGRLSRETRRADTAPPPSPAPSTTAVDEEELDDEARARAEGARRAIGSGSAVPVPAGERGVERWVPVDEEELGVTRRQFFNRSLLAGLGLGIGGFGAAALGFLWPVGAGGFGGKVVVGTLSDINDAIATKVPFYNAGAKTYVVPYPKTDVAKAKKVSAYPPTIISGMEQGYVALYQRCVHLGCRVPFCETSQWFECPCHGSKYNRVGEKRGGPAPRGLDRFPLTISGGQMTVDTGTIVQGPPIGTDTTGQTPEGAPCV